ncbi:MAG TPA: hypothetical protein VJA27_03585 [Patescibacteria group bacterium]|nr:hypothetical protein [Patescibacteria group bacterium]
MFTKNTNHCRDIDASDTPDYGPVVAESVFASYTALVDIFN